MSADATGAADTTAGRLRALLVLLCGALALVVAANSSLAVALPDLAADLGADQTELTWIVDAYALTFAALLLPAGFLADRIGRRTVLVAGLVVFGLAGVASAYAAGPGWLIGWRALAGIGAAAVFPVTLSALVDAYPQDRRGFAVAVWSGVSAAGAVLGTLVSGALLEAFWWGSVQLAFGVAALAVVPGVLALVAQNRNLSLSTDPIGALLAVVGLGGLVFAVIEAPRQGWTSPATLVPLAVGVAGLIGFVLHERRTSSPALDVRLFRDRGLATGSLLVALQFFASLGLFVLAPQYLQLVLDYSALQAALALLVIAGGVGAGTALAPPALERLGARWPGAGGLVLMAAGFALLAAALPATSYWPLAAGLLVFGLGFGLAVTPGTVLILDGLPAERRSVASAVNDITREVGGVLGIAVLSSVLVARYRAEVEPVEATLPPELAGPVADGAGTGLGAAAALGPDGAVVADAVRDAFTSGFAGSLWVAAGVLAAGAAVCAVLAPARPRVPEGTRS
ncbi:MAG TPA: MFS transporter [Pseudonocardia sp.]|nr:MFS transporter [Pseudonocardia sp.]